MDENTTCKQTKNRMVQCASCDWTGTEDSVSTADIKNFWQRVNPGELVPAGECPLCGSLCYVDDSDYTIVIEIDDGDIKHIQSQIPIRVFVIDRDSKGNLECYDPMLYIDEYGPSTGQFDEWKTELHEEACFEPLQFEFPGTRELAIIAYDGVVHYYNYDPEVNGWYFNRTTRYKDRHIARRAVETSGFIPDEKEA